MKIFQLKLFYFYNKSATLKTIILPIVLLFCVFNLSAQEESNIKLKIEIGVLWDSVDGRIYLSGPFFYVEPKLKASKNTVIGLRMGAALNTQAIKSSDPLRFYIGKNSSSNNFAISLIPTFDYYFAKNKFRPYLGLGVGYYFLTTSKNVFVGSNVIDAVAVSVNNQIGILLRGGLDLHKIKVGRFDLSKFIVGLEFNYIPKADVEMPNGQKIGTIANSNIALSIGHTIGNGKSSK